MAAVLKIRALITECRADIAEWNGESGDDPEYHALLDFLPKLERLLDEPGEASFSRTSVI